MIPEYVTPGEIAAATGLTRKHVVRMLGRCAGAGPFVPRAWYGARVQVDRTGDGLRARFDSLPAQIQAQFPDPDQLPLPLPERKIFETDPRPVAHP